MHFYDIMKYNFDEIISREHTGCLKYDIRKEIFGTSDVIPMWVADMDFKTPDFILEALRKRLEHPVLGYFYHTDGFYDAIINWVKRRHQWEIKKEWILFSPGIVPGLSFLVQTFSNVGDKVIVQTPVYHPFYAVVEKQGREIVRNRLILNNDGYEMDFDDLENKLKAGAKMMIICNPHNPVARCWKVAELRRVAELCLKYNCLLVSDEIHADLIMKGYKHTPTAKISPEIAQNTITCMAPSKTFNMAGLATSEIIIPNDELRTKFQNYMENAVHIFGNIFGDVALEAAYNQGDEWLDQLNEYVGGNVQYCKDFFAEKLPMVKTYRHEATYLLWVNFKAFGLTHEDLYKKLIFDAKLGFNDGKIFGEEGDNFMRINLACPRSTVEEAMHRIEKCFK